MSGKHTRIRWRFKSYFRARAFGRRSSRLAIRRLDESVSEVCAVCRWAPIEGAEGAVWLIERISPTFELIETSSGALHEAVNRGLGDMIPLVIKAPARRVRRSRWLNQLWGAIQNDGISYLAPVEEFWGELCGSADVASHWADEILPALRAAWSDWRPGAYVKGTDLCLSSLLAAERFRDLLDVLSLKEHPIWPWRRYGIRALLAQCRFEEALTYAEGSRGLNIPDAEVDSECERVLLAAGRREEAYRQYALKANEVSIGVIRFRRVAGKYPEVDRRQILSDLASNGDDPGEWFTAATNERQFAMAFEFARKGGTAPRTLSRAARDFLTSEPLFALHVGRLAVERILAGDGHEITALDLLTACENFMAAASRLGMLMDAKLELAEIVTKYSNAPLLLRRVVSAGFNDGVAPAVA